MSWTMLIPASLGAIGSICLGMAIVLILLDMPGGVAWSKVAGWFALVGGFGTLGGVGGWLGNHILWGSEQAMSFGQQWGGRLIGGGVLLVILAGSALWSWKHLKSNGTAAGGKGAVSKRVRAFFKAGLLAMVGAMIASIGSPLYDWINTGISAAHTFIV